MYKWHVLWLMCQQAWASRGKTGSIEMDFGDSSMMIEGDASISFSSFMVCVSLCQCARSKTGSIQVDVCIHHCDDRGRRSTLLVTKNIWYISCCPESGCDKYKFWNERIYKYFCIKFCDDRERRSALLVLSVTENVWWISCCSKYDTKISLFSQSEKCYKIELRCFSLFPLVINFLFIFYFRRFWTL